MDLQQLTTLQRQIEDSKTKKSELTGQLNAFVERLQKDWKCVTVKEAEKRIAKMDDTIADLDDKIETKLKELEEEYESQRIS